MSGWRTTQNQTAVIHIQNLARLPQEPHQAADWQHPGVLDAGSLLRRLHTGHLRPRHRRRPTESGPNHGQYPLRRCLMLSAIRSRWGQRLGQKRATGENDSLCKTKIPEILRFRGFLARREGFEPPAFWSVGCLKHKSEPFRLRFVLFTATRSADFPLFPFSPARFFRILGQKWVKDRCTAGEFEQSVRIHAERLIGQQLFLPKGLRLDHFIGRHGLWQELQNRELEVRIPIRVVAEQLLHQLVVAVQ